MASRFFIILLFCKRRCSSENFTVSLSLPSRTKYFLIFSATVNSLIVLSSCADGALFRILTEVSKLVLIVSSIFNAKWGFESTISFLIICLQSCSIFSGGPCLPFLLLRCPLESIALIYIINIHLDVVILFIFQLLPH